MTTYVILDLDRNVIYENTNYLDTLKDYQQLREQYNYERLIITTRKNNTNKKGIDNND